MFVFKICLFNILKSDIFIERMNTAAEEKAVNWKYSFVIFVLKKSVKRLNEIF